MAKLFEVTEFPDDHEPPPGGWQDPTCTIESHKWVLEVEEGTAHIRCLDPCDASKFNPAGPLPHCEVWWEAEDVHTTKPIPIRVAIVDESTTAGPWGPAEYSYYLEVSPGEDNG